VLVGAGGGAPLSVFAAAGSARASGSSGHEGGGGRHAAVVHGAGGCGEPPGGLRAARGRLRAPLLQGPSPRLAW
jgi:hypothetical protein